MNAQVEWNSDETMRLVKLLWPNLIKEVRKRGAVKPAPRRNQMIAFIRKYAKGAAATLGGILTVVLPYVTDHTWTVAIGVALTVLAVVAGPANTPKPSAAAPARPAAR